MNIRCPHTSTGVKCHLRCRPRHLILIRNSISFWLRVATLESVEQNDKNVTKAEAFISVRKNNLAKENGETQANINDENMQDLNDQQPSENDEAHFWLNGYVNKQNCRIWSEANPQVYVETPLHPEKLTVCCALWAGGILLQKR
ncbi:hypothetical protein TNCV_3916381 [Trichonephila clavipes]|nr:hypothetical protein TNCV_3916381 [Trichonephila clavipes]